MSRAKPILTAALVALTAALLLVGVVSHTPLRHAIQVAPGVAVLALGAARQGWSRFAAMGVFAFWFVIMTLIWLFLLGLVKVVTGHFTGVEIALTIVIGLASLVGFVAAIRVTDSSRWPARLAAFVAGAVVQVGCTWVSVLPMFATR